MPAKGEDLFAQPLYMSLLLGRNVAQPLTELGLARSVGYPVKAGEQIACLPDGQCGANHALLNEAFLKAPAEFGNVIESVPLSRQMRTCVRIDCPS